MRLVWFENRSGCGAFRDQFRKNLLLFSLVFYAMLSSVAVAQGSINNAKTELPIIYGVQTSEEAKNVRFILDVDRPFGFKAFALTKPDRLVIDLPPVSFEMTHSMEQVERSIVKQFRFGVFGPRRSRIVLDLSHPVKVSRAYNLPPIDGNPLRVVIELEKSTGIISGDTLSISPDGGSQNDQTNDSQTALTNIPQPKDKRPLVVLDPGHGGIDTGAVSSRGLVESKLVLNFAKALKARLEADGLVRVVLTRDDDVFVSLRNRVKFAQAHHADLFVSIHADTVREKYVRGATVYTLSNKASDAIAASLASRENRSDLLAGLEIEEGDDVVADILVELTRRETTNHSNLYSRTLVGALKQSIKLSKTPERSAGFRVLKAPDIPSVLLELGYLSNDKDQSALTSQKWRKKAINSIALSLKRFFERRTAASTGALPVFDKSGG